MVQLLIVLLIALFPTVESTCGQCAMSVGMLVDSDGTEYKKDNYKQIDDLNAAQCAQECSKDIDCSAAQVGIKRAETKGTCYMKTNIMPNQNQGKSPPIVRPSTWKDGTNNACIKPSSCMMLAGSLGDANGKEYKKDNYKTVKNVDVAGCIAECNKDTQCTASQIGTKWGKAKGDCFLKTKKVPGKIIMSTWKGGSNMACIRVAETCNVVATPKNKKIVPAPAAPPPAAPPPAVPPPAVPPPPATPPNKKYAVNEFSKVGKVSLVALAVPASMVAAMGLLVLGRRAMHRRSEHNVEFGASLE